MLVHNLVYENYMESIPKGKVVKHNDGDPTNCEVYNLHLAEKGNLKQIVNTVDIAVVVQDGNTPPRHYKNLHDLTVFLNRDFNKHEESDVINIMNNTPMYTFGDLQVTTCLYEYGEEYPEDIIWDESFPQYDKEDDCVILDLNSSTNDWSE